MRYLIVKVPEAVIVNHHIGGHETFKPPEGHIEVAVADDVFFDIGWNWNGKEPVDPNPPEPKHKVRHRKHEIG